MLPVSPGNRGLDLSDARGSVQLLGRSMGSVLKYAPKQRLTHDYRLMTCVSSSVWLPHHIYTGVMNVITFVANRLYDAKVSAPKKCEM